MESEKLEFVIEDNAIAELFGRQNFSTQESAILELVKNSFDANATHCQIFFNEDCIQIIDNGSGMSHEDIISSWMKIGKSGKGYKSNGRVLSGSKGVGRFALARLGNQVDLCSKKDNFNGIRWYTNWDEILLENSNKISNGTTIKISHLRDKWNKRNIDNLSDFLSRAYNDDVMKIEIISELESRKLNVLPIFVEPILGENFVSKITIKYFSDELKLLVDIESDEFLEEVQDIVKDNIKKFTKIVDLSYEYDEDIRRGDITYKTLQDLGDFSAELYFNLQGGIKKDYDRFKYKHYRLRDKLNTGIILYRNSFSISSMEGRKDWLDLGGRARKSPAAASHPNGKWRVRSNQLSGIVRIDKEVNKNLVDMANRQGLEENDSYEYFVKIISLAIGKFEEYRQNIIRQVNKKNFDKEQLNVEKELNIKKFIANPKKLKEYSEEEAQKTADEVKNLLDKVEKNKEENSRREQEYRYDARILNLLATQGLRANNIAHDLSTRRTTLLTGTDLISAQLQTRGMWEELSSERIPTKNVPKMLRKLEEVNKKLVTFLNTLLGQMEKRKFKEKISSLEEYLNEIKKHWNEDYKNVDIKIVKKGSNEDFFITADILEVIFDNLILNSIQQNFNQVDLCIEIMFETSAEKVNFSYKDNGCGLSKKYKVEPFKIMEVHESSREDGHGLGMWIVRRTIESTGGEIVMIEGDKGFNIEFNLRGVE
ncbi:ATP-binding protein [Lactococcus petauri]|uniref:histidine kinase n=1 Tax=Lactococcus petauri TaxID=1940789 RepID=A0A252CAE9_9LACT|nr:ATP-binding protein [Lactococcus petauri]OUK02228.1 hypothetical protein BZZ03_11285 [Lactococcus petauri]